MYCSLSISIIEVHYLVNIFRLYIFQHLYVSDLILTLLAGIFL